MTVIPIVTGGVSFIITIMLIAKWSSMTNFEQGLAIGVIVFFLMFGIAASVFTMIVRKA